MCNVIIREYPFVHGAGRWRLPYFMALAEATESRIIDPVAQVHLNRAKMTSQSNQEAAHLAEKNSK
jgi:hypothetical protein